MDGRIKVTQVHGSTIYDLQVYNNTYSNLYSNYVCTSVYTHIHNSHILVLCETCICTIQPTSASIQVHTSSTYVQLHRHFISGIEYWWLKPGALSLTSVIAGFSLSSINITYSLQQVASHFLQLNLVQL